MPASWARGDREQVGGDAPPAGRGSCRPRGSRRSRRRPSGCRWPRSSRRACTRGRRSRARRARRRAPAACSAGCRRPARCRSRGATRAAALPREQALQVAGRSGLAGVRARRVDARVEGDVRALERVERERADHVGAAHEARGASASASPATAVIELRAVDERQAFLRLEHDGREPDAAQRFGGGHAPALEVGTRPRRSSASARWASGARSPLAPTEPCEGTTGCTPRLSIATRRSSVSRRMPRVALGEHVGAQQHQRARLGLRERRADARGVASAPG